MTFQFRAETYHYYYSPKGRTWKTERSIEVPIIQRLVTLACSQNKRILEVGNVLSSRFPVTHDVLDKYEIRDGIVNEDVVDFNSKKNYDLIISISTMEHVGWDETPKDPAKMLRGIANLKRILDPIGKIVITMPIGQNSFLDELLKQRSDIFTKQYYMKRVRKGEWEECTYDDIATSVYDYTTPSANAVVIGVIES